MLEREVQINQEISQAKALPESGWLPNWALAPLEQGEASSKDYCTNDDGQLSCVLNEDEDGGEGSWSITPERKGVEFDHVAAGWAVHDLGCGNINGGVIGDRLWQAVNLGYEFPETEEMVVVTDLNGKKTCEVPAEDFFEAVQAGLVVIDNEVEAVVVEEVIDEQPQEEMKEVVEEVTEADKREMRRQIVRAIEDNVLDTVFSPKLVFSTIFCIYSVLGVTVLGFTLNYLRKRLLGSGSGGGGRKEPLVTGSDRRRSKDRRAALYDFFEPDD